MKTTNLQLPVFPLPIFLLPEGVSKLRIFELRYLKMIRIASAGQGFVIVSNSNNILLNSKWGSWVEIINFDQGADGILEVDVKCKSLVEINDTEIDDDNLHFAKVKTISHWSQNKKETTVPYLSMSLEDIFENNENLNTLYPEKFMNNPNWVIARWLELLPIHLGIKNTFVVEHNYETAKDFVESVIS